MQYNRLQPSEAERLASLTRALGRASQAASDVLIHGYDDLPRDSDIPYRQALEREIAELLVVVRMMFGAHDLDRVAVALAEDSGGDHLMRDLHHQEGVRRFEFVPPQAPQLGGSAESASVVQASTALPGKVVAAR